MADLPSLEAVVLSFKSRGRSLIRNADIDEQGTIRISTAKGAHLTADVVLEALAERESRRRQGAKITPEEIEENKLRLEYRLDSAVDRRRLVSLAPHRSPVFSALRRSRESRRSRALDRGSSALRSSRYAAREAL